MPIKRRQGEGKEDFIARCIPIEIQSGKSNEQAAAICYSYWDEKQLSAIKKIRKKKLEFESYTDYPEGAKENAKVALRWAEKNGWGSCGTPVGKARANQLAKGEAISEDTISRMAAFERHRQNSQKDLGDGCGRLMWLAWGGDEGVEWAGRKLKQIRGGDFFMNFEKQRVIVRSSNVDRLMWNSENLELVIRFNDGSTYTYFTIDEETFLDIAGGNAAPITSGENEFGTWVAGQKPSVGAAVHQYLIDKGVRFQRGGDFR